jgi:hypothetical protein
VNVVPEQRPSRPLLLFCAAFAVVAGAWLAWWWRDLPTLLHMDSLGYYKSAVNLARHGVFSEASAPDLHPISFRTPGYPAFLAVFFFVFGAGAYIPAILNLILLGRDRHRRRPSRAQARRKRARGVARCCARLDAPDVALLGRAGVHGHAVRCAARVGACGA